jgi:hypothetical protein
MESVSGGRGIKSIASKEFGLGAAQGLSFHSFLGWRLLGIVLFLFHRDKKYLVWYGDEFKSVERYGSASGSFCALLFFVSVVVGILSLIFFGREAVSICSALVIGGAVIAAISYHNEKDVMKSGAELNYMHHLHSIKTDDLLGELNEPRLDRQSMSFVAEMFRIKRKDKTP